MVKQQSGQAACLALLSVITLAFCSPGLMAQVPSPAVEVASCDIDLKLAGVMRDILSNTLVLGMNKPADEVRQFLDAEVRRVKSGSELLESTARHFSIEAPRLTAEVERFRHCNCQHAPLPGQQPLPIVVPDEVTPATSDAAVIVTPFAKDVLLHVVLHELGHALVREFDLPVLANEEAMADAFATCFVIQQLPDRAAAVLEARVASLMIEARALARAAWPVHGEHDSDARRAFQIAALAVAADATKYAKVAALAGMTQRDIEKAQDYGTEVHRSWRRLLRPLFMEPGQSSQEARVQCANGHPLFGQLHQLGLIEELEAAARQFDWHSQVTIRFVQGAGTAGWSRSSRTVTVNSAYLLRFIAQGSHTSH